MLANQEGRTRRRKGAIHSIFVRGWSTCNFGRESGSENSTADLAVRATAIFSTTRIWKLETVLDPDPQSWPAFQFF
jgi:hypothetical protein